MDYSKIHTPISFDTVKGYWKNNKDDVYVYVHNPFCPSICNYCFYKGTLFDKEAYDKYYDEYLPNVISQYKPILEEQNIVSYFFGGGTPSLVDPDRLRKILSLFPDMSNVREKIFEIHPGSYDIEQLDVLEEFGFNTLIVGVQTFNKELLKRQNRVVHDYEDVKKIVRAAQSKGFLVGIDLIVFLSGEIDDIYIFAGDITKCFKLDADEVSIQTDFKNKEISAYLDKALVNGVFNLGEIKQQGKYKAVVDHDVKSRDFFLEHISKMKAIRIFKSSIMDKMRSEEFFGFRGSLDELSRRDYENKKRVIGIGSYKNACKSTFSFNDRFEYIESNENWEPKFYMVYEKDFFRDVHELFDKIKVLGEPPPTIVFNIYNGQKIKRENTLYRHPTGLCLEAGLYEPEDEPCDKDKEYMQKLEELLESESSD